MKTTSKQIWVVYQVDVGMDYYKTLEKAFASKIDAQEYIASRKQLLNHSGIYYETTVIPLIERARQ